jgi:hypothetical protein
MPHALIRGLLGLQQLFLLLLLPISLHCPFRSQVFCLQA